MKAIKIHGQVIAVRDDVESIDQALSQPLADIKLEGVELDELPEDATKVAA